MDAQVVSEPGNALARVDGEWAGSCVVNDRGLMYGDGVFRTLRLRSGRPVWIEDQLERLAADARRLGIDPPRDALWQADLAALAERMPDAAVRLSLTRGVSARGYLPAADALPRRIAVASPLPDESAGVDAHGIRMRVCELRLGWQPALAGIKHLNRLENVLARMEWRDPAIHEGVLLDTAGHVVSAVSGNLFILRAGELVTPILDRCGVAGVARARLMRIAPTLGYPVREARFSLEELLAADAVLVSNSLIRLRWVAACGERRWSRPPAFDAWLEEMGV